MCWLELIEVESRIYLDYNASAPPDPEVVEAMLPWLGASLHANPHAAHLAGHRAARAIEDALGSVAQLIGAFPEDLVITSGATESNNLAIQGLLSDRPTKARLLHSSVEHKAVTEVGAHLRGLGVRVDTLPIDARGRIDAVAVAGLLANHCAETTLLSVMHGNNEIGTVQDVRSLGVIARDFRVLLHVDAAQTAGKVKIDVSEMEIDLLSMSSHKMYGPAGVGVLYISPRVKSLIRPLFFGGGQQKGIRPGTLPTFLVVGFGKACEIASSRLDRDAKHVEGLATAFCGRLERRGVSFSAFDCGTSRLPGLRSVRFHGVGAEDLMLKVSNKLSVSTGSACAAGSLQSSYVLREVGLTEEHARETIRIGFGRYSTESDAFAASEAFAYAIDALKRGN